MDGGESDDSLDDLIATKRRPVEPAPLQWPEHVHKELTDLHQALQAQRDKLAEREAAAAEREGVVAAREAALERRERLLDRDAVLVRSVLSKEATRLFEEHSATLEQSAVAHHERLEAATGVLRQQCDQLRDAKSRAALDLRASLASLREAQANHNAAVEPAPAHAPAPAPAKARPGGGSSSRVGAAPGGEAAPQSAQAQLREVRQRLSRAYDLSAALLRLGPAPAHPPTAHERAEAYRCAVPGCADALLAAASREAGADRGRVEALLRLLWVASSHPPPPKSAEADAKADAA
eukprot:558404-Prymnesium_polylepis.1